MRYLMSCILFLSLMHAVSAQECQTWPRLLPPEGIEIPAERLQAWEARIAKLDKQLAEQGQSKGVADVDVLVKACRLAIQFREFYQDNDFAKCDRLLKLAEQRLQNLKNDPLAAERDQRLQVRGFTSQVDGSSQPVGVIMPEKPIAAGKKVPMFVWLHGRGDKATDLHFICERLDKVGEVAPADAVTLHAFGRHCVGFKSAGTTDVLEAIDFACANYPVDPSRIVLIGFSMGGAGVWHVAARNADRFIAASPGAGFAETRRYQNLTPDKYPAKYVQTLWSVYDVPDSTRNLFNLPVIAYSGENDKQIQAARVMEEAFQAEGRTLEHLIGPGMGHKYHPDVLKQLLGKLSDLAAAGRSAPTELHLQTRHLRVHQRQWISIEGQQTAYADTRVDAQLKKGLWQLTTKNVSRLQLDRPAGVDVEVDGQALSGQGQVRLIRDAAGKWQPVEQFAAGVKRPGLSGPIDDAFFDPFLFVTPTGKSTSAALDRWVACEQSYAITRWTSLMRGQPRIKRDVDVTADDMQKYHVVVWGDPESNQLLARLLKKTTSPFQWSKDQIKLGTKSWPTEKAVPVLVLPNPESPTRYLVINSGLTFRDGHDKTNSLQNPQLPDWALLDLSSARTEMEAGKVLEAGFWSDDWK